jgi:hypothetical protein
MSVNRRTGIQQRPVDPNRAARLQRDAGIERTRSITKGLAFGSVAAVACAGLYFSQALPGHTASSGAGSTGAADTAGAATSVGTPAVALPASPSGSDSAPAAPAYTPAPAYSQRPVVTSGSS